MSKQPYNKDTNRMEWQEQWSTTNKTNILNKFLLDDEDTGMTVKQMIYPKGYWTAWHTHPCGHGIYVLRGILRTNEGEYGPGSFVWWPEGTRAEHGSTEEHEVEVLFITNKPFAIEYEDKPAK